MPGSRLSLHWKLLEGVGHVILSPQALVPYFGKGGRSVPPSQLSVAAAFQASLGTTARLVLTTAKLTSFFGLHLTAIHFCSELKGISFLRV